MVITAQGRSRLTHSSAISDYADAMNNRLLRSQIEPCSSKLDLLIKVARTRSYLSDFRAQDLVFSLSPNHCDSLT